MGKYNIRANAMKLLSFLYPHCDTLFRCEKVDCSSLFNENYTMDDHGKATKYLKESNYIMTDTIGAENMSCEITAKGIDWVEDFQNKTQN